MCFVFIWEQTATCATYSINWLVFITERKSVYSAVRTGSLNRTVCASSLKVNIATTVRSVHTVFMCFVFIWEQTGNCATYSINWLVFITEMKSVYSAVRTESLNKTVCAWSLKVNIATIVRSVHTVFMCFVFIWEQTATCATYSINWLVSITEMKSVYSAVRTGSLIRTFCAWSLKVNIATTVRSAHTVFMCFVFIWEQTATCATYSTNWLVFITEINSVYSAVRTGSLIRTVCAWSLKVNIATTVRSAHTVFMCFVFIWEQTATCATYSINCSVFITEMKSVYCAVRTVSLNKAFCASSLKGFNKREKKLHSSIRSTNIAPYDMQL